MSQIYSKITVGLGLAGIFLYGFYRKILNGDNFSGSEMSSNQNMHVMRREMLQQMQRTQETVVQLQRELEALRRQIRYRGVLLKCDKDGHKIPEMARFDPKMI